MLSRRRVSLGGTDHTSHRLARLGLGINRAVFSMYLAAGLLGILAVFMTHSAPQLATALFLAVLATGFTGLAILERARPIPPNNPLVVILAEDGQGIAAIRAARTLSSNLVVLASPRADRPILRGYLRALAADPESFGRWLDSNAADAAGPADAWHAIFRLAGRVQAVPEGKKPEKYPELFRDAHLIVFCRGEGWPAEIRAAAAGSRVRLLAAPGGEVPGSPALADSQWNDPAGLARAMEEIVLGIRRKEKNT
jgi:hypothetical protein